METLGLISYTRDLGIDDLYAAVERAIDRIGYLTNVMVITRSILAGSRVISASKAIGTK
jgi:hypothetical protein